MIVGNSHRLTAISRTVSAAAAVNTHHSQPRCGAVTASSAIVAITATPSSTSTAKAPAREGHDASGPAVVVSSAGASGVASSTAVTRGDLIQLGDLVRAVGRGHLHPQPVALLLVGGLRVGHLDPDRHQHVDRAVVVVLLDRGADVGHRHLDVGRLVGLDHHAAVQAGLGAEVTRGTFDDLRLRGGHRRGVRGVRCRDAILGRLQGRRISALDRLAFDRWTATPGNRPPPHAAANTSSAAQMLATHQTPSRDGRRPLTAGSGNSPAVSTASPPCSSVDTANDSSGFATASSGAASASVGFSRRVPASPSIRRLLGYSNC